jgi:hypothetical protein
VDWPRLEALFSDVDASREGGASYPILTCVKLLLLQQWHGLSDPASETAADDRLSFRRICGIPLDLVERIGRLNIALTGYNIALTGYDATGAAPPPAGPPALRRPGRERG